MKGAAQCAQAEILAGAIALGEAGDSERNAYRAHLSTCRRCLDATGGEREIERVMLLVAQARDQERWQPDVRRVFSRTRSRQRIWTWGTALAALAAFLVVTRAVTQQHHPMVVHGVTTARGVQSESRLAAEARAVAALDTQTVPKREHRAESLAFGPAGGVGGTMTLQVSVDERGKPTRCTIVKRSGHVALDTTVCRAVMQTRR